MTTGRLVLITMALAMAVFATMLPEAGVFAPRTAQADDSIWGPTLKGQPSTFRGETTLDVLRRTASGPIWLMAEGLDPRLQQRPDWDVLTKLDWGGLSGPFLGAGLGLQSPGAALVPFRDPAPAFSRNIILTRDFSNSPVQTEPHIAVDPNDPEHLIVGVIDFNFPSNTSYVSFDGGQTWEGPFQVPFPRDDLTSAGDPVVAFGPSSNAHFISISIGVEDFAIGPFVFTAAVSSIAHSSSNDGGMNWSESLPSARAAITSDLSLDLSGRPRGSVSLSFLDKPWLAVGAHPSEPGGEIIYVTYTEFATVLEVLYLGDIPAFALTEVQTTIKLVRSEDSGLTWSEPIAVSPTARRISGSQPEAGEGVAEGLKRVVQGSQPVVTPDGTVYVAWMDSTNDDSQEGLAEIYVVRSDDSGRNFADPVRASLFRETGFRPKTAFFRYWGSAFPQVTSGPEGEIYIVYVGLNPAKPTDDGDVYFIRSLDRGVSWSRPKRLGGDETDRLQFFPAITTDPKGNLHVMWGDMRDDPVEIRYHIYYTTSDDQGETWGFVNTELDVRTEDTRMTDFPSNVNKGFPNGLFIGDYFAIAASEDDVYAVWADTRLGEFGPFNQKIGFARRTAIRSADVFLTPPAGPGGQEVTLQGFNFQPELTVFIQVGGVTVATGRTNSEGRFTGRLFMPVSGEGAQDVVVFDESGNVATTSFFAEFGFGSIRDIQRDLEAKLEELLVKVESQGGGSIGAVGDTAHLSSELERVLLLLEESAGNNNGANISLWVLVLLIVGGAGLAAVGAAVLNGVFQSRRRETTSIEQG